MNLEHIIAEESSNDSERPQTNKQLKQKQSKSNSRVFNSVNFFDRQMTQANMKAQTPGDMSVTSWSSNNSKISRQLQRQKTSPVTSL